MMIINLLDFIYLILFICSNVIVLLFLTRYIVTTMHMKRNLTWWHVFVSFLLIFTIYMICTLTDIKMILLNEYHVRLITVIASLIYSVCFISLSISFGKLFNKDKNDGKLDKSDSK